METKFKDFIKKESNPLHDLSGHTVELHITDYFRVTAKLGKHLIRGSILGAGVGSAAATALISEGDLAQSTLEGMVVGSSTGSIIDLTQYIVRYAIYRAKHNLIYPIHHWYMDTK
jgi:hypothetical protein